MRALIVLFLLMFLAGCATTRTETIVVKPPAVLVQDCPVPAVDAQTWGDLPAELVEMRNALVSCNRDKEKLRQWAETL